MRRPVMLVAVVAYLACFGAGPATVPAYDDPFAFLKQYRIQHYLESAVDLQKLEPAERAERLKKLAADPTHKTEVYPLCRMLFEAKPKGEFRRPMIGGANFVGRGDYADWPLEPITIVEHVPVLIVRGYVLSGEAEPPASYVDYCLKERKWSDTAYAVVPPEKRKEIIDRFISSNPKVKSDADWLRQQAE